jgi:hypothetical protein
MLFGQACRTIVPLCDPSRGALGYWRWVMSFGNRNALCYEYDRFKISRGFKVRNLGECRDSALAVFGWLPSQSS